MRPRARPEDRPPSLTTWDPRRTGRYGRGRRRLGLVLLAIAAGLTAWWAIEERPAPPAASGATGAAPHGCADAAPATAVPVHLPQEADNALAALVGEVVCFTHDLLVTEVYDLGRHGELLLADRRLYAVGTGLDLEHPERHVVRLASPPRPDGAWPLPWDLDPGDVRVGDAVLRPWGRLVAHPRGGVAVLAEAPPDLAALNPRPTSAPARAGDLRVAMLNVGNLFVTLGDRGARTPLEAERQRDKLVAALRMLDADVLALAEVERGGRALATLRDALNAALEASGEARRYRAAPEPARSAGGDVVGQAFLYDPGRVELLAVAADTADVHLRPPVAATFRTADDPAQILTVVAVHHRSRAGCPASGQNVDRGFGCWNALRTRQSAALLRFGEGLGATHGPEVLIVGDLNAHRFEPPIELFEQAGGAEAWRVLTDLVPPEEAYSYVFFGRSAALDHAIASASLAQRVRQVAYLPINADEPPLLAAIAPPGLPQAYAPDPFRSSDHDPVLVDLGYGDASGDGDASGGGAPP